jgi:hypothetical protein
MFLDDLKRELPRLAKQVAPSHDVKSGTTFRH